MTHNSENLPVDIFIQNYNLHLKRYKQILSKNYSINKQYRKLKNLFNNIKIDKKQYEKEFTLSQKNKCINQFNELIELSLIVKNRKKTLKNKINKIELKDQEIFFNEEENEEFNYSKTIKEIKKYFNLESNEPLDPPYNEIFSNSKSYNLFLQLHEVYKDRKNRVANYSSIFYAMEHENYIISGPTAFKDFLINEYFEFSIDRIDSTHKWKRLTESNHIINTK